MESRKQLGLGSNSFSSSSSSYSYSSSSSSSTTPSSLASELFGSKETSSSEFFGSLFPPPSKSRGNMEAALRPEGDRNGEWKYNYGTTDDISKSTEEGSQSRSNRDVNSIYQEQRMQPCHLSSSIYYGGQENYSSPQSQSSGIAFKKDPGEDDSGSASRGNWWQGGLYY